MLTMTPYTGELFMNKALLQIIPVGFVNLVTTVLFLILSPTLWATENVSIRFERIDIPTLISVVYRDILQKQYLIHSEILSKNEVYVSVNLQPTFSSLQTVMLNLLDSYDISIENRPDYLYFKPKTTTTEIFTYKPMYRSTDELIPLLDSFSRGNDSYLVSNGENLVLTATNSRIHEFKNLLRHIDQPVKQVNVRAYVYEVNQTKNINSNALKIVLDLFSSNLNLDIGSQRSAGNLLRVSLGSSAEFVFSALNEDSRFRVISSPSLLVRHAQTARFTVGTETPVLSSLTFTDNGDPVQDVEYRRSGVIFDVTPRVHLKNIDLDLNQQVSTFINTTTGVDITPTLLTRELSTTLSLRDGDLVVMAGLRENRTSNDDIYFPFTNIRLGHENDHSVSDIILLLHCQLVTDSPQSRPSRIVGSVPFQDMSGFLVNLPGD